MIKSNESTINAVKTGPRDGNSRRAIEVFGKKTNDESFFVTKTTNVIFEGKKKSIWERLMSLVDKRIMYNKGWFIGHECV